MKNTSTKIHGFREYGKNVVQEFKGSGSSGSGHYYYCKRRGYSQYSVWAEY